MNYVSKYQANDASLLRGKVGEKGIEGEREYNGHTAN
jgi:hypothetical protein